MPTFARGGRVVTEYHEAHNLLGPASEEPELHPDTAPEVIAARQRQDVLVAWGAGLSDPAAIGRALVLPVGSVRRFLFELGLAENPDPGRRRPRASEKGYATVEAEVRAAQTAKHRDRADLLAKVLGPGRMTALQLAAATGLSKWQVLRVVLGDRRFQVIGPRTGGRGRPAPVYGLAEAKGVA